jgi:hypothetical protein
MERFDFRSKGWYVNTLPPQDITVIGAGGIGSHFMASALRLNHIWHLYDHDVYEEHNLGGQTIVTKNDLGKNKAIVIKEYANKSFLKTNIETYGEYQPSDPVTPIMVSCVDKMSVRKMLFENWLKNKPDNEEAFFLDGRMSMLHFEIYAINRTDQANIDKYLKTLISLDYEAPCSLQQTYMTGSIIGGVMLMFLSQHFEGMINIFTIRDIPYSRIFSYDNLSLKDIPENDEVSMINMINE